MIDLQKLHDYIERAGDRAIIMVSQPSRDALRDQSISLDWQFKGNNAFYRGAFVELHDEWSWGWMVRKADGSYVKARP